jgi:hypothetical protein
MKRIVLLGWSLCVAIAVMGCSQSSQPKTETANAPAGRASVAAPTSKTAASEAVPKCQQPDEAVATFLKALRDGDDHVAEGLLTPKAREETAKRSLTVQPPGTPGATFEIGKVEYLSADKSGAHVNSVWHEKDEKNATSSYDIVWALRRLNDGWHIAGMATQVAPDEPPVFLNFEDPDDMLEKWKAAEERLAGQNQGIRQASKTQTVPAPSSTR